MTDNFYLQKFGYRKEHLPDPAAKDLKLIVVIPAYREPDLLRTIQSIYQSEITGFSAEIIVVINASEKDTAEIKEFNLESHQVVTNWIRENKSAKISTRFIIENNLPKKHAGVGLARKIGMDEAVYRFHKINFDGIIICADADACYDENFLNAIHTYFFVDKPQSPGCSIYFEHPLSGDDFDSSVYGAIRQYELYLRYYKNALSFCGFPFAFHTIGSSMAVRSSAYQKSGGMNKRKAGEDFYFLQKIIELGNFGEVFSTIVKPSPRASDRVPFGTGRSVSDFIKANCEDLNVYTIEIFDELKNWNDQIESLYLSKSVNQLKIHPLLKDFLFEHGLIEKLNECISNTGDKIRFTKRFYRWFDAFMVLKACHYLRDNGFGACAINSSALALLNRLGIEPGRTLDELLILYRHLDKKQDKKNPT